MVRSIFLGHFIPSVLQPTIVKFLFIFNCMSVSLYELSTVSDPPLQDSSTRILFLSLLLPPFFISSISFLFFSYLIIIFFFLLQCIDVTWRGTSINCFLFGRLDRMIAPWRGRRIYLLSYGESLFFKASKPFPTNFSFRDTLIRSLFLIQFNLLSIFHQKKKKKKQIQSISIHYFIVGFIQLNW